MKPNTLLLKWSTSHPVPKLALFINLMSLGIWGPVSSCIGLATIAFVILIFARPSGSIAVGPWLSIIICGFSVLIVVPGGNPDEIIDASILAVRLLEIMLISSVLGSIFSVDDALVLKNTFRLPWQPVMMFVVASKFVPISLQSMSDVFVAQRARGLELNITSLLNPVTYYALLVPYLLSILRSAVTMWISLHLRPLSDFPPATRRVRAVDVILLVFTFPLWFDFASFVVSK